MAAIIQNNLNVVIANHIGQWMWAYLIVIFLGPLVFTWIVSRFFEPKLNIERFMSITSVGFVILLTFVSAVTVVIIAIYYSAPLSEAEMIFLDVPNQGWKTGIVSICGWAAAYNWRSTKNDRVAQR